MPSKGKAGVISIVVGLVLAVVSIGLTGASGAWRTLGVSDADRVTAVSALTILFLSTGFLIAFYFQQEDFRESLLEGQRRELESLRALIPSMRVYQSYSGDNAMAALIPLVSSSRVILNTRISAEALEDIGHGADSPWDKALVKAVRSGVIVRDVVSASQESLSNARVALLKGGRRPSPPGSYHVVVLDHQLPSFMNYIVLEDPLGVKEVWFGWIVSSSVGFEGPVIRSGEERIVAMFEHWHRELSLSGRALNQTA